MKRGVCVNPFCDGYGAIDVSKRHTGTAWELDACAVGPHPPKPDGYRPEMRGSGAVAQPNHAQRRSRLAWTIAAMIVVVVIATASYTVAVMLLAIGDTRPAAWVLLGATLVSAAMTWIVAGSR